MSRPRHPVPWWLPGAVYVLTLAQLAFAALVPGIERFADKAFGARLLAYAVLMAVVPVIWFVAERRREAPRRPPYGAFTLVMLPFLVAPFGVFLMRQFILGLPRDLLDAGRVDGAGELRIFARIILPLCGPALATLGILTFLGSWNNFLWPLVVAQTEDTYTLPVALALYAKGQNSTNYGLLLAGATVVTPLPGCEAYAVRSQLS